MADTGIAPAVEKTSLLKLAGASDDAINQWKAEQHQKLVDAGADQKTIDDYFGTQEPDTSDMKAHVKENLDKEAEKQKEKTTANPDKPLDVDPVKSYYEAFKNGLQLSTTGLAIREKMPDQVLPEHADDAMQILQSAGQVVGDLPQYAEGMAIGGIGGTAMAGPVGGIVGAAGVGWAFPAALRKIMVDHYQKGDIQDSKDFLNRLSAVSLEAIKAAGTGIITEATGGMAGKLTSKMAGPLAANVAQTLAEVGTMTTVNAAMEGHLPSKKDFYHAGILVAGLHGVSHVAGKLMNEYAANGAKPDELAIASETNPILRQEMIKPEPGEAPPKEPEKVYKDDGTHTEEEKQVLSHIIKADENTPGATLGEKIEQWRINNLDYGEKLKTLGADDAYKLLRRMGDIRSKIRSFFWEGTREFKRDGTGNVNGEAPVQILKDMVRETGSTEAKFVAYWAAARALELDGRGIETPFMKTKADAVATAKVYADGKAMFDPYVKRMVGAKNKVIDYYAAATGMDKKNVAALKELNKEHFPFHKLQEVDELTGKGGGGRSKGLKKIVGGSGDIVDPMKATFQDMEMLIMEADKNNIRRHVWDKLGPEENGGDGFLRQVETPMKKITVTPSEMNSKEGILSIGESLDVFRPENKMVGDGQAQLFIDGKRTVVEGDPQVIDVMKRLDGDQVATGAWVKLMQGMAKIVRVNTTGNPAFGLRHTWRSQRGSAMYSDTGMNVLFSSLANFNEASPHNEMFRNFLYDGAGVSSFDRMDRTYLEENVFKLNEKTKLIDRAWNVVKNPLALTEHAIQMGDNLSRFTEYKNRIERGESRADAAYAARNVAPDYQRVGAKMAAMRSTVAFLNVHMQVTDRAFTEIRDNPKNFMPKLLAGVTAPAILLWLADHNDDRIKETPNYLKNVNSLIPLDWWKPVKDEDSLNEYHIMPDSLKREDDKGNRQINVGPVLRVPGEGEPFMVFGSMVTAALNAAYEHNPEIMGQWAKDALSALVPIPIQTGVKPVAEHLLNHSFFTNRDLVSPQMEKYLPSEQYEPYTSEVAKQIGEKIGYIPYLGKTSFASPIVIDNYIRGWSGGLGQYAVQLMDAGLHAAGVGNTVRDGEGKPLLNGDGSPMTVEQPSWTADELPFVKEFVVKYPAINAASVEQFSNRARLAEQIMNSTKKEDKRMDPYKAQQLRDAYGPYAPKVQQAVLAMTKARQAIQGYQMNPVMSPNDKRQLIKTTLFQLMQMAHQGNEMMDEFEKNMKENESQAGAE